jgi:hypothetical protein
MKRSECRNLVETRSVPGAWSGGTLEVAFWVACVPPTCRGKGWLGLSGGALEIAPLAACVLTSCRGKGRLGMGGGALEVALVGALNKMYWPLRLPASSSATICSAHAEAKKWRYPNE